MSASIIRMKPVMQLICAYLDQETIRQMFWIHSIARYIQPVISPVTKFMIEHRQKDFNDKFELACELGNIETVKYMIAMSNSHFSKSDSHFSKSDSHFLD